MPVPTKFFLTKGIGVHKDKLGSFEHALRNAGIARFNLVEVSSILPPGCLYIQKEKGLMLLKDGEIVYTVMSKNSTNEPYRRLSASVGIAMPKDKSQYGYLSEYHAFGIDEEKAGEYAEDLAATMLASTLGVPFNPDASYDEKKEIWKISNKIVETSHITHTAVGDENGLWTTVVAAAVFIVEQ